MASAQGRLDGTRFAVLVFTNLTQDHLDFHGTMEEYFESKRRLFAQAARAVDQRRRRVRATPRRRSCRTRSPFAAGRRRSATIELKLHGPLQRRERARARPLRARALGRRRRARSSSGIEARRPACRDASSASTRASRSRSLVDYAHTPGALETRARGCARARRGGRVICVFGAGGDRDRGEAAADGTGRRPSSPDVALVTSDNPRSEDPAAIAAEVAGRTRARGRARPRARDRAGARARREPATSS